MASMNNHDSLSAVPLRPPLRANECFFKDIRVADIPKLVTRTLDQAAKARLFGDNAQVPEESLGAAKDTLKTLHTLAPSVARTFCLKDAGSEGLVFRLVNDADADIRAETSYIALSYRWRQHALPAHEQAFAEGGIEPPTTTTMFAAILAERESKSDGLWVDQLCIDQSNETEQAQTVANSDLIYKSARTVVVALDDVEINAEEESFLRDYLEGYQRARLRPGQSYNLRQEPPYLVCNPLMSQVLRKLLGSEYFERAWCGHELWLSERHIFLVRCVPSEYGVQRVLRMTGFFLHSLVALTSEVSVPGLNHRLVTALLSYFASVHVSAWRDVLVTNKPGHDVQNVKGRPRMPHMFVHTAADEIFRLKAGGNPRLSGRLREGDACRDRVSIVLNTVGLALKLSDPHDVEAFPSENQALGSLMLLSLAAGDAVALCSKGQQLDLSWIARPSQRDHIAAGMNTEGQAFPPIDLVENSIALHAADPFAFVELAILNLETSSPPASSLDMATHFVEDCIAANIGNQPWHAWDDDSDVKQYYFDARKRLQIEMVVCVLTCGFARANGLMLSVATATNVRQSTEEIIKLYSRGDVVHPQQDKVWIAAAPDVYKCAVRFILNEVPDASDPLWAMYCARLVKVGNERAIVCIPSQVGMEVGVPAMLRRKEYAPLARGWALKRKKGGERNEWTLHAKSRLYSGESFAQDLESSELKGAEAQRVYGLTTEETESLRYLWLGPGLVMSG